MTIEYNLPVDGSEWCLVFIDTTERLDKAITWAHDRRRRWLARTIPNGFEIVIESIGNEDIHNEIYGWSKGETR